MFSRRLKTGYFVLEGLNSFATVYYFYYVYFFMQQTFGFGNKANLALAALGGGVSAVAAWQGGKFAQRFGYFNALKLGFSLMPLALGAGMLLHSAPGHLLVMCLTLVGVCFTWPALEALVSEGESAGGVQHMVGLYNAVWAGTAALAYFTGGAMLVKLGPKSLFYVPVAVQIGQLGLTFWLESRAAAAVRPAPASQAALPLSLAKAAHGGAGAGVLAAEGGGRAEAATLSRPSRGVQTALPCGPGRGPRLAPQSFLRMAWLANPCAYIAINTVVAVIPGIATRLQLSTMVAGFCCSIWCFARLAAFLGLWAWDGWHYRFRWLLLSYLALVGSFIAILLAPSVLVLVGAQLVFGGAIGLIYYSSLFYSMHVGDTKGEHGGIHEAVIGLGNCAGPAVGAASLCVLPQYPNSGAFAVSALLLLGLGGLGALWHLGHRRRRP